MVERCIIAIPQNERRPHSVKVGAGDTVGVIPNKALCGGHVA